MLFWVRRKMAAAERRTYEESEKNSERVADDDDPLAEELDFTKLKRVGLGPGWALVPKHLRSPKHMDEARAWLRKRGITKASQISKNRSRVA
jgi:hypothetical protein